MNEAGVTAGREFAFVCPLANGFHARPASQLAEVAVRFAASSTLVNSRTGSSSDMKSVLAIIAADIRRGDSCVVRVHGTDEEAAASAIGFFLDHQAVQFDELPAAGEAAGKGPLPRALQNLSEPPLQGTPAGPGVAEGAVVISGGLSLPDSLRDEQASSPEAEAERLRAALAALESEIERTLEAPHPPGAAAILKAHLAMTADPSLLTRLHESLAAGRTAGAAIVEAGTHFMGLLRQSQNVYTRERAADIQELALRLLEKLYGREMRAAQVRLTGPSIVVADSLAPQQLLAFDRRFLKGLVLEEAGATSHAVILARSAAMPVVVGVSGATTRLKPGTGVVVDGERGLVLDAGDDAVARFYLRERVILQRRAETLASAAHAAATTRDGKVVEVGANTASLDSLDRALVWGADGIGLFRTEMLLMERQSLPGEDEQFEIYAEAARRAAGRPVILRTFDIGGDKPVPCLDLAREANPFLGVRGVRLYREMPGLFETQIRAMLRASACGNLRAMVPMVSSVEESRWARAAVELAKQELTAEALPFDAAMPLGLMIEVPSAAFQMDGLCDWADFFSIGTNDLSQYFFAVDRENPRVAPLADVCDPGFLRLLQQIVRAAHSRDKWIGLCGEMASDANCLPLLLGLDLDEISAGAGEIPGLKERISMLSTAECRRLLDACLRESGAAQVRERLKQARSTGPALPLLDRNLVRLGCDSQSKEEALRDTIDLLYAAGRTEERDRVEEVVWQREAVYSTGLGFGVAVPHCKTDAMRADSIAVLGLAKPVAWGAVDDEPVRLVILLAIRAAGGGNRHLQVFSKLARRLMDAGFRERLLEAEDQDALVSYLRRELDLGMA